MPTYVATREVDAQPSGTSSMPMARSLGRVATDAAKLLQGKHKAIYTPYLDTGDHVVIVNAAKVKLTGRKEDQKVYQRHSGYPGGLREDRAKVVRAAKPRAHDGRSRARHAPEDRSSATRCSAN